VKVIIFHNIRAVARPWQERRLPRGPVFRECQN
jgi:hypothetical protein